MEKETLKKHIENGDTVLFGNEDTEDFAECFIAESLKLYVISFNGEWVHSGEKFHTLWLNLQKWINKYNLLIEEVQE